jgi:hypothetical protein
MSLKSTTPYPAEIVLHPDWWYARTGLTFDEDFFYHPARRVEVERIMDQALYERWGRFGLGGESSPPQIGAVHLAAGFLLSEMCSGSLLKALPLSASGESEEPAAPVATPSVLRHSRNSSPWWRAWNPPRHGRGDVNWGVC